MRQHWQTNVHTHPRAHKHPKPNPRSEGTRETEWDKAQAKGPCKKV